MANPEKYSHQEDLFPHESDRVHERYVPRGWMIGESGKVEDKQGNYYDNEVIEKAVAVVTREAREKPHLMDGDKLPDDLVRFYAATFQREKNETEKSRKAKNKKKK